MNFRFSFFIFLFLSFFTIHISHGMLVSGDTLVSPDATRYVALLGHLHDHKKFGWDHEEQQLKDLVAIAKEAITLGKKIHIFHERLGDTAKFLMPKRSVMAHLEELFQEEQIDCVIENVEIRDDSLAAMEMLSSEEGKWRHREWTRNENSKFFGQITIRDVCNELDQCAKDLEEDIAAIVENNVTCQNVCLIEFKIDEAKRHTKDLRDYCDKNKLDLDSKIFDLESSEIVDRRFLDRSIFWASSYFFDLHIFRKIIHLDSKFQPIVISGAFHTQEVRELLIALDWQNRICPGSAFGEVPLSYGQLRQTILNETDWERVKKKLNTYVAIVTKVFSSKL